MRTHTLVAMSLFFVATASTASIAEASPLRILLTNDDGWSSPALQAAKMELRAAKHEVFLVAPAANRSGSGASLTLGGIAVTEQGPGEFSVDAAPASCVLIGLALMGGDADLVISGPNIGFNGGNGGIHSGTVGAAMTGVEQGRPALAVATDSPSDDPTDTASAAHFANVARFLARFVDALDNSRGRGGLMPHGVALKVSYPPRAPEDVAGVQVAQQGEAGLFGINYAQVAPGFFVPSIVPSDPTLLDPRSDTALYMQGYVTVVPLDIDQSAGPRYRAHVRRAVRRVQP